MPSGLLFTDPGALKFLLIIPAIVLLYMVRSRYRRRRISSTMLWQNVRHDLEARQQVKPPPLSLLMLLQLLAVALGTIALLRPALPAQESTHLVVLVDTSISMEATDVAPSRFEVAVDGARQAIQSIQPGDQVSLVAVGATPRLLASGSDTGEILAALGSLHPGSPSVDLPGALLMAQLLIRRTGGHGQVLLLSDGVFGASFQPPATDVPVIFRPIGAGGNNQGVTAIDVRPDLDGSGRWSGFARVTNYSDQPVEVTATATADDLLLDNRPLKLGAKSSSDLSYPLPAGTKSFALRLITEDILPADDQASIHVDLPQTRRVLLVSDNPAPIQKVLAALPGLQVSSVSPQAYKEPKSADLVILDDFVPPKLPQADLLIMNPPAKAPGFVTEPAQAEASVLKSDPGNPLINSVDLQSLRLAQTVRLQTPQWAHTVVEGPAGPLVLEGDLSGRKVVILAFDWLLHDLPRMQAFPLLISNAIADLNPLALPESLHPGETVLFRPMGDATEVTVQTPDGTYRRVSLEHGAGTFGDTTQVGHYTATWKGSQLGEASSSFDVNVADAVQSDITPREYSFPSSGGAAGSAEGSPPVAGRQLWPFAALALLGLMSLEWLYFTRRS